MSKTKDLQDARAALQQPGMSVEVSVGGDKLGRIEDPRALCLAIAETVEHEWSSLDDQLDPWPRVGGEPKEYQSAPLASEIADALIGRIAKFEFLKEFDIGYVYRHKDPWTSKGRLVHGEMSKSNGLTAFYSGHDWELKVNWLLWLGATPWQKVALIYHELRHADVGKENNPAIQGHDAEIFFDELEIFGTETYRDWKHLEESASKGAAVRNQYHMDLK